MGWIVLVVIVLIAFFFISIYNRLVGGRNAYKNAFAQIDVQLTRRHDLIPNLVETAKGYMKHERGHRPEECGCQSRRSQCRATAVRRRERAERRAGPVVRAG
jgi:hypothetical protein